MFYLDKNGLAYLWGKIKSALDRLVSTHKEADILDHPDGSVTTAKLAEGAVTKEKIAKGVIPTSLPASDVYDWAKQPEKPTYTAAEVGADSAGSADSALTAAKKYTDKKVKTNVPENAVFTDTVYDDTEIKTALNGKLDKSGGTISSPLMSPLKVERTGTGGNFGSIEFLKNGTSYGHIGIAKVDDDVYHVLSDTSKQYPMLDSNNYKSIISTSDSSSAAALSSSDTNYPTVRDIYYGLPNINGSHAYTSGTSIYAPTSTGNTGYELISNGSGAPIWKAPSYAVCSTSASTAAKTASIANFKLVTGATVKIKFTYAHTSSSAATLNVNSTGAKTIYTHSGTSNVSVTNSHSWRAGEMVEFVYDGSYWVAVSSDQGFVEVSSVVMQNALDNKLDGSWSDANGYANIGELSLDVYDAFHAVWGNLGIDNEFAGIYELAEQVSANRDAIDTKAPTSHASTATTYGIGTSSNYGHVKLSDSTSTTSGASAGVAATPTAVKAAYNLANTANNKANITKNTNSTTGDIITTHLTIGQRANDSTYGSESFSCGTDNTVSGSKSVAVGQYNTASGSASVALGYANTASAHHSVAMGQGNKASGYSSVALGYNNNALNYQIKLGRYAADGTAGSSSGTTGDALIVGIGERSAAKNGFRVDYSGKGYFSSSVSGTGADYAEMWEWQDGNPNGEDRVGYFVAFDGTKIRLANETDDLRKVGIISGNPAVIGDNFADDWQGMYLKDIYGRNIKEHKSYEAEYDSEGNLIHEAYEADEYVLNPDYDATQPYTPREARKEWDAVGTHGKLVVKDDGTCQVDGFCRPTDGGIATASEDGFYVMERINDTLIRVYLR